MGVGLGIAAVLMLADPIVERILGHEWFYAPIAWRASVIEWQFAVDRVGKKVGAAHGKSAHRVRFYLVVLFIEIVSTAEPVMENIGVVKDCIYVL